MLLVGAVHLVIADDVVAAALVHRDGVRPGRVAPVPAARAIAWVVNLVPLDDHSIDITDAVVAARGDPRVLVDPELPAGGIRGAVTAPAAHVVPLDDDVVLARLHDDAVLLRALDGEATDDHVARVDADAGWLHIRCVGARRRLVEHIVARRTAFGDVQRLRSRRHRNRARRPLRSIGPGRGVEER